MNVYALASALVLSNIVYQVLRSWLFRRSPDWAVAAERSYFQTVAVLLTAMVLS